MNSSSFWSGFFDEMSKISSVKAWKDIARKAAENKAQAKKARQNIQALLKG